MDVGKMPCQASLSRVGRARQGARSSPAPYPVRKPLLLQGVMVESSKLPQCVTQPFTCIRAWLHAGLGLGVKGAAAAAALGQYAGAAVVFGLLVGSRVLKLRDLTSLPSWEDSRPYVQVNRRRAAACAPLPPS
jgi:hypothetical protein